MVLFGGVVERRRKREVLWRLLVSAGGGGGCVFSLEPKRGIFAVFQVTGVTWLAWVGEVLCCGFRLGIRLLIVA